MLQRAFVMMGDTISNNAIKRRLSYAKTITSFSNVQPTGKPLEHGAKGWGIHSDITPQEEDIIIQKTTPDSFLRTSLDEELKKRNIEHLFIAGIQTEACVDTTCRIAFSLGYKVTLVSDTHSTWDSEEITAQQIINHHNGVLRWFVDVYPSSEINFNL